PGRRGLRRRWAGTGRRRRAATRARAHRDGIDPTRPERLSAAAAWVARAVAPSFSPTRKGWGVLAHVEHEIEPCGEGALGLGHAHHQLAAEQAVATVHRLLPQVKARRKQAPLPR